MTARPAPRPVSDVLTDLTEDGSPLSPSARQAVKDGLQTPHWHCPCPECMRAYLRSVERRETRRG